MGGPRVAAVATAVTARASERFAGRATLDRRGQAVLTPAAAQDAAALAPRLRRADRRELAALGRAPLEALTEALAISDVALTLWRAPPAGPPRIAALLGAAPWPEAPDVASPWMMGSDDLPALSKAVVRRTRVWAARLGAGRSLLVNAVDARNALHIRWLQFAGFTFFDRLDAMGPERRPFLSFAALPNEDLTEKGTLHV